MPDLTRPSPRARLRSVIRPLVGRPTTGPSWPPMVAVLAASLAIAGTACAQAQTAAPPAKHNNNTYGSPLDTIKSSRLWTSTPVPKDFVRESRPDPRSLDYAPLTGSDPERPKPRDAANVAALQAEMERAGAGLAGKAPRPKPAARKSATGKPAIGKPAAGKSAAEKSATADTGSEP